MRAWLRMACAPAVVSRATRVALVVGTILVAINQGELIVTGGLTAKTLVQITLTYMIPYLVSTYVGVEAARANNDGS